MHRKSLIWASIATILTGCASQPNIPATQAGSEMPSVVSLALPRVCKGEKKTSQYGSATETLGIHSGLLCVPSFKGLGGTLAYPSVKPVSKMTVTSTPVDYKGFPYPGSGTVVLYVQIDPSTAVAFGNGLRNGSGLIGKGITPKSAYTAFSATLQFGLWHAGNACYSIAGTSGITNVGSLLKGQSLGAGETFLIEVYPGQQSNTKC